MRVLAPHVGQFRFVLNLLELDLEDRDLVDQLAGGHFYQQRHFAPPRVFSIAVNFSRNSAISASVADTRAAADS
ncbi:hypothetical protein AUC71_04460 [Methyloceanibacter marginalis]|uniref:Uncharacterized protein n=1 Tax=Methyloceanibacter marginalis TaxID=1774971 RepID=A0A1E3VU61_9HYPH|nr:hypothetical protein AUC71_04460 [Methyloceanibacter marginalis]